MFALCRRCSVRRFYSILIAGVRVIEHQNSLKSVLLKNMTQKLVLLKIFNNSLILNISHLLWWTSTQILLFQGLKIHKKSWIGGKWRGTTTPTQKITCKLNTEKEMQRKISSIQRTFWEWRPILKIRDLNLWWFCLFLLCFDFFPVSSKTFRFFISVNFFKIVSRTLFMTSNSGYPKLHVILSISKNCRSFVIIRTWHLAVRIS